MTEKMVDAGVEILLSNKDKDPDALAILVWQAMKDAKQKEAMENYRALYL
jgi:DNA-binding protein YbaB